MIEVCCSGSTLREPLNIMCSKKCAKPVRPGFSFFEPTWYQSSTWTIGVDLSWWRITTMPLGSTRRWYSSLGGRTAACSGTYQIATAAAITTSNRIESILSLPDFRPRPRAS